MSVRGFIYLLRGWRKLQSVLLSDCYNHFRRGRLFRGEAPKFFQTFLKTARRDPDQSEQAAIPGIRTGLIEKVPGKQYSAPKTSDIAQDYREDSG